MLTVHITKRRSLKVTTFREASRAVSGHWDQRSGTAFYRDPRAGLIEIDGETVAYVSYNGRVWKGTERVNLGPREEIQLDADVGQFQS